MSRYRNEGCHLGLLEETAARAEAFFAELTAEEAKRRDELLAELDAIYWQRQKVEGELQALNKSVAARAANGAKGGRGE